MAKNFDSVDYCLFALTLCVPALISVYFGCFGSKQKSVSEYLYGKGKMNAIPIGLSLYSSAVSSLAIIGTTSEVYVFGAQFLMVSVGGLTSLLIKWKFILPVFCGNLNIKIPYQYFELRFNKHVRTIISTMYIFHTVVYLSIVLYVSTVSFSETTEIPLYICTTIIGSVCAFYTMLGGFKGVIWTDVLQASLMLGSCFFILYRSAVKFGGFGEVLSIAEQGGRTNLFNFDPNPFQRLGFFSTWLGMAIISTGHDACAASGIQRFMAVGSEFGARISTTIQTVGYMIISIISGFIGLFIYAMYSQCDPISTNQISSSSQILPHFINDITGSLSGFQGLFAAGLLSAGLSSLSAELNCVSGLIYYDFIQKFFHVKLSDLKTTVIMKIIIIILGAILIIIAPLLEKSKYIYQFALTLSSWTYGAKVGVMLLGTTFPKSNSLGAICGMFAGLASVIWISLGAIYYNTAKSYVLPVSVENCTNIFNNTIISNFNYNLTTPLVQETISDSNDDVFILYKLSFLYYALLGAIITVVVGLIVSYISGFNDVSKMDPRLIIPELRPKDVDLKIISQKIELTNNNC